MAKRPVDPCVLRPQLYSYNADNADALDERYGAGGSKPTGMYDPASGLDHALLCFTGPEYMYMLLR